jgi:hypothetical protein
MGFTMVERAVGKVEDLPGWLVKVREAGGWLVLREFSGVTLDESPLPGIPDDEPQVVPGVIVEGASWEERHNWNVLVVTVWGHGSMHELVLHPPMPVVAFMIVDGDS